MEYYELYQEKHVRLVECLAELLTLKEYVKELENYTDGLESITTVDHGQTRPRRVRNV